MDYFAQGIGLIGMALIFSSFQTNDKKKILIIQSISGFFFTIHFLMLGVYTGAATNLVGIFRNLTFAKVESKKSKAIVIAVFTVIFAGICIFTWENIFSLFPVLAMALSTVAFSFEKPLKIRLAFLPSSVCWLVYNIVNFSIAGMLTETFNVASLSIAFARFDFLPYLRKKAEKRRH